MFAPAGDLTAEIAYGIHPSAGPHVAAIREKMMLDVIKGRSLAFERRRADKIDGIRISPVGVVENPKFRIIHDLTFVESGERSSVNNDTDFTAPPPLELGHVLREVCMRILYLRQLHGVAARVMLCRIDVKEAYRQVRVDPGGTSAFGYVVGDNGMVDLRLQFGWRNSPGFWGLTSSALEHAHTHTTFCNAVVSGEGRAPVDHVRIQGDPLADVVPLPSDCLPIPGKGMAGDPFFVPYYVDDGILAEVQFFPDARTCMRAIQ